MRSSNLKYILAIKWLRGKVMEKKMSLLFKWVMSHVSTVPLCPLLPVAINYCSSVPTALCADGSALLKVPPVPLCPQYSCAHCSSVPSVSPPSTVPPSPLLLCAHSPSVPLCPLFLCLHCSSLLVCARYCSCIHSGPTQHVFEWEGGGGGGGRE